MKRHKHHGVRKITSALVITPTTIKTTIKTINRHNKMLVKSFYKPIFGTLLRETVTYKRDRRDLQRDVQE